MLIFLYWWLDLHRWLQTLRFYQKKKFFLRRDDPQIIGTELGRELAASCIMKMLPLLQKSCATSLLEVIRTTAVSCQNWLAQMLMLWTTAAVSHWGNSYSPSTQFRPTINKSNFQSWLSMLKCFQSNRCGAERGERHRKHPSRPRQRTRREPGVLPDKSIPIKRAMSGMCRDLFIERPNRQIKTK